MTNQLATRRPAVRRAPRVAAAPALRISPPTAHCPLPTAPPPRRGISLLEVLISMFVLLFGLMGVAAVFPVGNHYAGRGEQFDRGTALAQAAMADLKARGMLKPEAWLYAALPTNAVIAGDSRVIQPDYTAGTPPTFNPTANLFNTTGALGAGHAFVIDPLGEAAARNAGIVDRDVFPFAFFSDGYDTGADLDPLVSTNNLVPHPWPASATPPYGLVGTRWPIRRLTLPTTDLTTPTMTTQLAETIFRLHDDVTNELPQQDDRPAIQRWSTNTGGNAPDKPWLHTLLARQYAGSYSWIATVVPTSSGGLNALQPVNPQFGSELYEVSVAVFNKRELTPSAASERSIAAVMNLGGELVISAANNNLAAVDNAVDGIRAGNWIMVAGVHQGTGQFLLKWYRILSIDDESQDGMRDDGAATGNFAIRRLMLDGTDWPMAGNTNAQNLRAILLPGVISVATQMLPMEPQ